MPTQQTHSDGRLISAEPMVSDIHYSKCIPGTRENFAGREHILAGGLWHPRITTAEALYERQALLIEVAALRIAVSMPAPKLGAGKLINADGEVVVELADGWSLRSGVYAKEGAEPSLTSGEYVRLCKPDGDEYAYWDQDEWRDDPALVMGAIINSAAGLRMLDSSAPSFATPSSSD